MVISCTELWYRLITVLRGVKATVGYHPAPLYSTQRPILIPVQHLVLPFEGSLVTAGVAQKSDAIEPHLEPSLKHFTLRAGTKAGGSWQVEIHKCDIGNGQSWGVGCLDATSPCTARVGTSVGYHKGVLYKRRCVHIHSHSAISWCFTHWPTGVVCKVCKWINVSSYHNEWSSPVTNCLLNLNSIVTII